MERVGAFEAKTHLSKLLDRVAKGERFIIERHGVPVATLAPADATKKLSTDEIIEELARFRKGKRLDGITIRELIEDGRK